MAEGRKLQPFFDDFSESERQLLNRILEQKIVEEKNLESKSSSEISINLAQFKPEEIKVDFLENQLIIEAKHDEKSDEFGQIQRHFIRKFNFSKEIRAENLKSELSSEGILSIKFEKLTEFENPIYFVEKK